MSCADDTQSVHTYGLVPSQPATGPYGSCSAHWLADVMAHSVPPARGGQRGAGGGGSGGGGDGDGGGGSAQGGGGAGWLHGALGGPGGDCGCGGACGGELNT